MRSVSSKYVAGAEKVLNTAQTHGWTTVSMKRDWSGMFPDREW
jgi:hypothetical protein